jgi:hypothetical protein
MIWACVLDIGFKWSAIAARLPGRTKAGVRQHFMNKLLQKEGAPSTTPPVEYTGEHCKWTIELSKTALELHRQHGPC